MSLTYIKIGRFKVFKYLNVMTIEMHSLHVSQTRLDLCHMKKLVNILSMDVTATTPSSLYFRFTGDEVLIRQFKCQGINVLECVSYVKVT